MALSQGTIELRALTEFG